MECLTIVGGERLNGTVRVSGSKNAALPILAASILADRPIALAGVPELTDVRTQRQVLEQLGVRSERAERERLRIETVDPSRCRAEHSLVRRMRASFCVLGPLLAARGKAVVALPGGCNLGVRPVDLHLRAFELLGAEIRLAHGYVIATASRLQGAKLCMLGPNGPSVTGTANAMCAATRAAGVTLITHAAREPEIANLAAFLRWLGADVEGEGTDTIAVRGSTFELAADTGRCDRDAFPILPDRIEAGTLLLASAAAGGSVCVQGIVPEQLSSVLESLAAAGARLAADKTSVAITMIDRPKPCRIVAEPYPGMPTDLQAQWTAVLAVASGKSSVSDAVFPERFLHVAELIRMGARIWVRGNAATVDGMPSLQGADVQATDLRGAAALVIAGLAARGMTTLTGLDHLDRGYERLDEKLRSLGAKLVRNAGATDGRGFMCRDRLSGRARFSST